MKKWIRSGLICGGILYVIVMIVFPMIDHENFDIEKLLIGIPLWVLAGLCIGYLFEKKKKKSYIDKKNNI